VIVKFDDATERTRLSGTITLGTPVADLSGAFAVEATGASPDRRLFIAASGVTAFVGKGKDTTITTDDVGVSFSNGEMLAVINASGTYAFDASGTAGLTGIDSISLTGTLVAQKNTTGSAVSEDLTIGGTTKTLTVAKDVSKVSGTLTLSTENSLYLTGTIGVEKKTASLKLEDGTTVNTTAVQLGGTGISGFVGLNATPGHTDQTGVSLSNLSFGYTLASPTNSDAGKDLRTWSALKAAASSASLVGVDVVTATVSSLHLNLNRAGGTKDGTAATKTADFASSPLANTVGGQSSTLDFVGSILQAFALIEFSVSGFASIRGRFGIDLGNMDVKLPSFPDVDLPTSFLRMWGIDVDVSVGINGPSWSSPDFTGFDLRDVDFNLQINTRNPFTGLLPQLGAMKWFTLEASIPELTFAPFLDILAPTIDATIPKLSLNLTFDVPTGIDPIPYIDYRLSLPTVTLPAMPAMPNFPGLPDLPALPSITGFSFNMPPVELLQIGNIPSLNLFNFLSVTGSLTFKRVEYTAKLQDGSSVETWALVLNSTNGGFFAGVNGPGTNSGATGASVSGVNAAMAVLIPKDFTDKRRWVAATGSGSNVSLVGLPGLTLSATDIDIELNKPLGTTTGGATNTSIVNFFAAPLSVTMSDGSTVSISHPSSSGALLRVSTDATVSVADFFRVTGNFGIQTSRSQRQTL
jgi:hypothetical protein